MLILEQKLTGLAAVYGSGRIPASLEARIGAIFDPTEIRSRTIAPGDTPDPKPQQQREHEGLELVSHGEMAALEKQSLEQGGLEGLFGKEASSVLEQAELDLMTDLPFDEYMEGRARTRQDLLNIYQAIEYLRFVSGEKHLLFFTSKGLFLPALEDGRSLASMASDARVRIHTFHTRGPSVAVPFGPARSSMRRQAIATGSFSEAFALSSLRKVSSLTGGRAFIGKYIDDALETTNQTTRAVYLLGYRPKNTDFDGRFRKIEVRVRGKDLKVYSRGGYYARSTPVPYDREEFMTYARTVAAVSYGDPIQDVAFSLEVDNVVQKDGNPTFDVILTFHPREEMFNLQGEMFSGRLVISWFVLSREGALLSTQSQALNMNLRKRAYRTVLDEGFSLSRRFEVPGRAKTGWLKIILYDPANDKLGSLLKKIS